MCICTRTYRHGRPPLGRCTRARPGHTTPGAQGPSPEWPQQVTLSHTFLLKEGRGWREEKGGSLECGSCGFYLTRPPPTPQDLSPPPGLGKVRPEAAAARGRAASAGRNLQSCARACVTVCEHLVGEGTRVHLSVLWAQPHKGLRTRKPSVGMVTPV